MNHSCRLILNDAVKNCVPAAGFALQRTRRTTLARAIALALSSSTAFAVPAPTELPSGGQVTAGSAGIAVDGSRMDVNQASQNAGLNWQTFNIGQNAQVDFHQPNASAVAVNRIADPNGSQIMGRLNANGQVYLINPNGILFGQGSQVNVGGLVASTLDISDADAASNRRTFSSPSPANGSQGQIVNQGTITAAEGGYVALLGGQVSNQGLIQARLGTVALAAGDKVTLDFAGDKLLSVQVDKGALQALAENQQLIQADGGMVLMTAKAADSLIQAVVNNEGVIEARTVEEHNGVIKLLGDMDNGTVNVGGTLDASALPSPSGRGAGGEGADGGFIETSAAHVHIADDAHITTAAPNGNSGTWLIDPIDFTIASGSGALTTSGIGAATLATSLGGGNVAITTDGTTAGNGDIFVNSAVSWSANNKLTLTAHRNIVINASLNGSGAASSLALEYGQGAPNAGNASTYTLSNGAQVNLPAGGNFSTKLGNDVAATPWTVITTLGAAGDATVAPGVMSLQGMNTGLAGNYVLGANIDASATSGWAGGFTPVGRVKTSLPFVNTPFTGKFDGLGHTISNLFINRDVNEGVGLFGNTDSATLQNVGLLNVNFYGGTDGTGALAGKIENSTTIRNSYAGGGSVRGRSHFVGGLVGVAMNTTSIGYSYANVSVESSDGGNASDARAGGLVGLNNGSISYSYATGSVTGKAANPADNKDIGGLVGKQSAGSISNSYATGAVSAVGGGTNLGGLVGNLAGGSAPTSSYWDKTTTGQATSSGSAATFGLTTDQWLTLGPIATGAWSSTDWGTGYPYPVLKALPYITIAASSSQTYGSAATFGIASILDQSGANASGQVNTGSLAWQTDTTAASSAGTTGHVRGSGASATGYQILYTGSLTVGQAPLTVTANAAGKTYDGLAWSGNSGVAYSGFVNGEGAGVLGGALVYGGSAQGAVNVGAYAITPSGLTSSNYAITFTDGSLTVSPAALTVTALNASKTYDGLVYSGGNGVSYSGFVNGQTASVLGGALAWGGSSQGAANAGSYAITPSGLTSSNYAITFADGSLTVNPATLTVTALNASKTYDGLAYSGGNGVSYSGFVNGQTASVLGGTLAWGGSSQGAANVGSYAITPSGLTSSNYTIAFADGSLAITPATLTYTATPASFFNGQTPADNATALTLKPGTPPEAVLNVMALLEADTLSSPVNHPPKTLSLSSTTTVAEGSAPDSPDGGEGGTESIGGGDASSPESGNGVTQNSEKNSLMQIGDSGSTFTIVQPGVKLPDYMVNLNE